MSKCKLLSSRVQNGQESNQKQDVDSPLEPGLVNDKVDIVVEQAPADGHNTVVQSLHQHSDEHAMSSLL